MLRDVPVQSYIVRIYRRQPGHLGRLVGVVEDVATGGRTPFASADALWRALRRTAGRARLRRPRPLTL